MVHIAFDWDGTIAKREVAEEANIRRSHTLNCAASHGEMQEMQKTHAHYAVLKEAIENYTGVKDERTQTIMMTNLFQLHYLGVVHEWQEKIFFEGMMEVIKKLKEVGITLSIVTALRLDIIEPALESLGIRHLFSKVYGNTPDLVYTKEEIIKKATEDCGDVHLMIGDREEDITAGKSVKAKTAFATWGRGELKEEKADAILEKPEDILRYVEQLN